ncbi:efflux RND transporter permease subunit [Luteitalea sp.]|jgi:cobalt-zinc-cadmium resistance protein CzcA|uniref:efflux RND transporter permease subunit n=1 Tax=Luteitalea sp. TaxID=2004800 RepID=UPI0025B9D847|nr:efflux RND transporter permease subunit [Luteitalea sp.]
MIRRLIDGSFRTPLLAILLVGASSAIGAVWLQDLRRDVFPDLSAPIFNVITQNASMGAEELETAIAIPMEVALAGLPDVRRVRSVSQLGVAQVTVEFEPDADYYRSRQFVAERVAQVSGQLPPGTEPPLISSLTGRLNEIFEFTLEASPGAADLMTLRDLAEFEVNNRLVAVPGVAAVERLGGYLRQYQVLLDPERLSARRITLDEVRHAVEEANLNASGGVVAQGAIEWTVRALGRAQSIDDLRGTVVAVRGDVPVLLNDVADVREGPAVRRGIAHRLKGEVVSARVIKQFGADTVQVAAGIRQAIEDIRRALPKGVQLRVVYDQSQLVDAALGGVGRAVALGGVFVVIVILVLLGNWRAALLVTCTIPVSIALAGLLLKPLGVGLNTMTMGGLAIAVGLLVDAAIIMVENILHRVQHGGDAQDRRDRARAAALEVATPIAFATAIVIVVFLPLFGMSGIEGRMYQPLAGAVMAAMFAALILAVTVVPVVASRVLRPTHREHEDVPVLRVLKRWYAPALDWTLRRPLIVAAVTLAILLPTALLGLRLGSDFMPELDEGAFLLQTVLPAEASLEEVDRLNHQVEDRLRQVPEVEDVVRRTGRAERTEDPMPHTISDVLVVLRSARARPLDAIEADMRERLEPLPGVAVLFTTPLGMRIDEGLGGTPADVSVRIFGPDLDQLARLAERAEQAIGDVQGLTDLRAEQLTGLPQLQIAIKRDAAARVGLAPGDIVRAVRTALVGEEASEIWIGQRRFDLILKLRDDRRSLDAIRTLLIDGHDNSRVPLAQVAEIAQTFGPAAIRREAGTRRIAVEGSVSGRDLAGVATDVRARLDSRLQLPAGYFFDLGGRVESQDRSARALRLAIATALFGVFVLLLVALDSAVEAGLILVTVPCAFVGGILALAIAGETWNVSSLVGLIGLFGIAVQNSLVLVTQTRGLIADGLPLHDAVREASIGRVRPKLMTAGTATLGLLPLLVLSLHGTEIERPLAIVMIGGLVTSTLFTLLVLPTFYMHVHGWLTRQAPEPPLDGGRV